MADTSSPRRGSAWRTVAINVVVLFCLLGAIEVVARVYIAWAYGPKLPECKSVSPISPTARNVWAGLGLRSSFAPTSEEQRLSSDDSGWIGRG
jgi:hypothetical protein